MEQLKHRIDALKRNVEQAQKKEMQAERQRNAVEMGIRNKEEKSFARMALEEKRQNAVLEKKMRVQSARRDRELSKARSKQEFERARSSDIAESKQMLAQRKAALEKKEQRVREKKLKTAAEVKKFKQEAA